MKPNAASVTMPTKPSEPVENATSEHDSTHESDKTNQRSVHTLKSPRKSSLATGGQVNSKILS